MTPLMCQRAEVVVLGRSGCSVSIIPWGPQVSQATRVIVVDHQQKHWLVVKPWPDVPVVRQILDKLNSHRKASLYQAFPAAKPRRIAKWLEIF